jgi:sialic acid synthase SpsE
MQGPDHMASLEPDELQNMVTAIRDIEKSIGNGIKRPTLSELNNRIVARKSLVAAKNINKGEPLVLACKRPGDGVSPFEFWEREGMLSNRSYVADELLDE